MISWNRSCVKTQATSLAGKKLLKKFKLIQIEISDHHRYSRVCRKQTIALDCLNSFLKTLESCQNSTEIESNRFQMNVIYNFGDIICRKDGDVIMRFIAENGPGCVTENGPQIIECLDSAFNNENNPERDTNLMDSVLDTSTVAELCKYVTIHRIFRIERRGIEHIFKERNILFFRDLNAFRVCAVHQLKKCENRNPGDLVDSVLKSMVSGTACTS